MCHIFGSPTIGDLFGGHYSKHSRRGSPPPVDPVLQAQIDAEQAANQRTAQIRKRRRSSTLFGAGNTVLGAAAQTIGSAGASGSALSGGGGTVSAGRGGGSRSGGRSGAGYALP